MKNKRHDRPINIRVPIALYDTLIQMATLNDKTLSRQIREILLEQAISHRINYDCE